MREPRHEVLRQLAIPITSHFCLNAVVTSVPKLRISHVITRLILGGAQENTVTTVLGLAGKPNVRVRLISGPSQGPEGSLEHLFADRSGLFSSIPELVRPIHPWKDWRALTRLTRIFRDEQPHIVHTHSGKAGILGRIAARRARVPIIVHTIHGPSFGAFQPWLPNQLFKAAERHVARNTDHFISVADAMSRQYLAAGIGRPEQYTRIFSGFDLAPFLAAKNDPELRSAYGLAPEDFVIAKLARLSPLKGHDDLLTAAAKVIARCPEARFFLIGDGPLRGELEQELAAQAMNQNFIFAGLVEPAKVPALLGMADVVVHFSRREGLPRALPQAMAAGKPVVAYDLDGAPEVCLQGQTGFLVKPRDFDEIAVRLQQLASDRTLRTKLGALGRDWVRERFSAETMVDAIYNLYVQLANKAGLARSSALA